MHRYISRQYRYFTWLRWYSMMTISCFTMRGRGPGGTIGSSSWYMSNVSFLVCRALVMDLLLLFELRSLDSSDPSVTNTTTLGNGGEARRIGNKGRWCRRNTVRWYITW